MAGGQEEKRMDKGVVRQDQPKKRRGRDRKNITLGGLKKLETSLKRKQQRKLNRKLGELGVQKRNKKKKGPPPPIRSVLFLDNTANGELVKRMNRGEEDLGEATNLRVRMAESAGTPLGILLTRSNPWGPGDCGRDDCVARRG